jgi:hypothetical protein
VSLDVVVRLLVLVVAIGLLSAAFDLVHAERKPRAGKLLTPVDRRRVQSGPAEKD